MFSNLIHKPKTFTPLVQETATVESDHTQNGENHHAHPWRQAWTPTILRSVTLVAFALLFAAMIVVIEVLSSVSARNQGLGTSESKYHYLWTYGPTAGRCSGSFHVHRVGGPLLIEGCGNSPDDRSRTMGPGRVSHQATHALEGDGTLRPPTCLAIPPAGLCLGVERDRTFSLDASRRLGGGTGDLRHLVDQTSHGRFDWFVHAADCMDGARGC